MSLESTNPRQGRETREVIIGHLIHRIETCTSTNDLARSLADQGAAEGAAVLAAEQTQGRGVNGHAWFSARGKGLYLSVILRPLPFNLSLLPLLAALGVREALAEQGVRIRLKWPNDLVWKEKKIGGILCEASFVGNRLKHVILGLGLNVHHRKQDFPEALRPSAVSLRMITRRTPDLDGLLVKLWTALGRWYRLFIEGSHEEIVRSFEKHSLFSLGERINLASGGRKVSGVYRGLGINGALRLESGGRVRSFLAARVESAVTKEG